MAEHRARGCEEEREYQRQGGESIRFLDRRHRWSGNNWRLRIGVCGEPIAVVLARRAVIPAVAHLYTSPIASRLAAGPGGRDYRAWTPAAATTAATTTTVTNTYDSVTPTSARSRPRSPVS